jgi:hypothetical protein
MAKRSHSVSRRADEDLHWSQISDRAERRRRQNRLAQRRFRKAYRICFIYLLISPQARDNARKKRTPYMNTTCPRHVARPLSRWSLVRLRLNFSNISTLLKSKTKLPSTCFVYRQLQLRNLRTSIQSQMLKHGSLRASSTYLSPRLAK